jgi:NAD(P)-dependent dehydrogenase (short-subunit alcohol dehydrogenase family)
MSKKLAMVTGAASGIGYEISRQFLQRGFSVIGVDINSKGLDTAAAQFGESFIGRVCDITDCAQLESLANFVSEAYGYLDVLVNNAGVGKFITLEDMDEGAYAFHFDTLVKGPMFLVKYCMPLLEKSSERCIINIASAVGRIEIDNHHLYSCAKLALEKFTYHLVRDYPRVRSNTILPGLIETPIYKATGLTDEQINEAFETISKAVPCGRMGQPADIANCVMFLSSDQASYISGASIVIDGGWLRSSNWGIQ